MGAKAAGFLTGASQLLEVLLKAVAGPLERVGAF